MAEAPMDTSDDGAPAFTVEAPVAPFVQQLFKMVNNRVRIEWSLDGSTIVVPDPDRFAAEVCPLLEAARKPMMSHTYFRHKNWNSFARMMNMYQFHKRPAEPGAPADRSARFAHPHFRRDGAAVLWKVARQKSPAPQPRKKKAAARVREGAAAAAAAPARKRASPRGDAPPVDPEAWRAVDQAAAGIPLDASDLAAARQLSGADLETWIRRTVVLQRRVGELESENELLRRFREAETAAAPQPPPLALSPENPVRPRELSDGTRRFLADALLPPAAPVEARQVNRPDLPRQESNSSVASDLWANLASLFDPNAFGCLTNQNSANPEDRFRYFKHSASEPPNPQQAQQQAERQGWPEGEDISIRARPPGRALSSPPGRPHHNSL